MTQSVNAYNPRSHPTPTSYANQADRTLRPDARRAAHWAGTHGATNKPRVRPQTPRAIFLFFIFVNQGKRERERETIGALRAHLPLLLEVREGAGDAALVRRHGARRRSRRCGPDGDHGRGAAERDPPRSGRGGPPGPGGGERRRPGGGGLERERHG